MQRVLVALLVILCVAFVSAQQQYSIRITQVSSITPVYGEPVLVDVLVSPVVPAGRTVLVADDSGVTCNAVLAPDGTGRCALGFLPVGRRTISAALDPCEPDALPAPTRIVNVQEIRTIFTDIRATPSPSGFRSVVISYCLSTNSVALAGLVSGNVSVTYGPQSVSSPLVANVTANNACGSATITIPDPGSYSVELAYTPSLGSAFPPVYAIYQHQIDLGLSAVININSTTSIVARTPLVLRFNFSVTASGSNREVRGTFRVQQGDEIGCEVQSRDGTGSCVATFNRLTTELRRFDVVVVGDDEVHFPPKGLPLPIAWVANQFQPTFPYSENFNADSTNANGNGYWFPFATTGAATVGGDYVFRRSAPNNTFIKSSSPAWWTPLGASGALDVSLYSPVFDLTGIAAPVVFGADLWFQTEANVDLVFFETSINNGAWTRLQDASTDINWYDAPSNAWSGETTQYVRVFKALAGAPGNRVQLRLVYQRSSLLDFDGVALDNVRLVNLAVGIPELVSDSGPITTGTPISVRVASAPGTPASGSVVISVTAGDSGSCTAAISAGVGSCVINFGSAGVKTLNLAFTGAGFEASPTNAYSYGVLSTITLAAQQEVYDDFETAPASSLATLRWYSGESSTFETAFEYGAPSSLFFDSAFSASNAWVTNLNGPAPKQLGRSFDVRTGDIVLTGVTSGTVYFGAAIWHELHPEDQLAVVEYRIGTNPWLQVGSLGSGFNGYNSANGFAGSGIFANNGQTWRQVYLPLPAAVLNSRFQLRLRYSVAAMAGTSAQQLVDGVAFDDFRLAVGMAPTFIVHTVPRQAVSAKTVQVQLQAQNIINSTFANGGSFTVAVDRGSSGVTFATTCTSVAVNTTGIASCTVTLTSTTDATVTLSIAYTPLAGFASSKTYVTVDVRATGIAIDRSNLLYAENFELSPITGQPQYSSQWRTTGRAVWSVASSLAPTSLLTGVTTRAWSTVAAGATVVPRFFDAGVLSPVLDFSAWDPAAPILLSLSYANRFVAASTAAWIEASVAGAEFVPLRVGAFGGSDTFSTLSFTPVNSINSWNSLALRNGLHTLPGGGKTVQFRVRADSRTAVSAEAAFDNVLAAPGHIDATVVGTYGAELHTASFTFAAPAIDAMFQIMGAVPGFTTNITGTVTIRQGASTLASGLYTSGTAPLVLTFAESLIPTPGAPVTFSFVPQAPWLQSIINRPLEIETRFPIVSSLPYRDDFEVVSVNASWVPASPLAASNIWKQGTPPLGPASIGNAWYFAPSAANLATERNKSYWLYTPIFNLTTNPLVHHTVVVNAVISGGDALRLYVRFSNDGAIWTNTQLLSLSGRVNEEISASLPVAARFYQYVYRVDYADPLTYVTLDRAYVGYVPPTSLALTVGATFTTQSPVARNYTFASSAPGLLTVTAPGNSPCVQNNTATIICPLVLNTVGRVVLTMTYQPTSAAVNLPASATFNIDVLTEQAVSSFPYIDTFEATNNWAPFSSNWQLGTPAGTTINRAFSPTKAWSIIGTGNIPAFSTVSRLNSPVFDLSRANGTVYAGVQLWQRLSTGASLSIQGLLGQTFTVTPANPRTKNYEQYWVQLPGGANRTAVSFIVSGALQPDDGVAIDDFELTTKIPTRINATAPANVQRGQNIVVEFQVMRYIGSVVTNLIRGSVTVTVPGDSCTATIDNTGRGRCDVDLGMLATGPTFVTLVFTPSDSLHHTSTASVPIIVHETVNLNANDFPYFDNFESGSSTRLIGQWIAGDSLWQLGAPVANSKERIKTVASGSKAWITRLNGLAPRDTEASLYSPVFDLTSLDASASIFVGLKFQCLAGPATIGLQARYDDEQDWYTIGVANDFLNWYNGNSVGWTGSAFQDRYYPAVHLVPRAARTFVQFRLQYRAPAGSPEFDGFAMDDFLLTSGFPLQVKLLSVIPNPTPAGAVGDITFQVDAPNNVVSNYYGLGGIMTVGLDSGEQCTSALVLSATSNLTATGTCSLRFNSPGERIINFELCGPLYYNLTTAVYRQTVLRAPPTITVISIGPDTTPVIAGLPALVRFQVQAPSTPRIPTGTVIVSDASGSSCRALLLADGTASCTLTFPVAGDRALSLSYLGDDLHAPASAFVTHTVLAVITVTNTNLPLADSFETTPTWVTDIWRPATRREWVLGTPKGVFINRAASGTKAWYTALVEPPYLSVAQYVYSSVYNTSSVRVGTDLMFSSNIWWNMGTGNLVWLETRVNQGAWTKLGVFDEETNWYNRFSPAGWGGTELRQFKEAFHQLVSTTGASTALVQMRFVLQRTQDRRRDDGFAFDDATVRLTAPVSLDFVPSIFPIPLGSVANVTVRTTSAFYNSPAGTFAVTLGDGQTCAGASDNAGEIRCRFSFTQLSSRTISATFTSSQLSSAAVTASSVLPVQATVSLTTATALSYRNNFETTLTNDDWFTDNPRLWQRPTTPSPVFGSASGTGAWVAATGDQDRPTESSVLVSPLFNMTLVNTTTFHVSAQLSYNLDAGDRLFLERRTNAGWVVISSNNTRALINWFTGTNTGFTGDSNGFRDVHFRFVLNTTQRLVQFRLRLDSSSNDLYSRGVAFDDFQISTQAALQVVPNIPGLVALSQPAVYSAAVFAPMGPSGGANFSTVRIYEGQGTAVLCTVTRNAQCNITLTGVARLAVLRFEVESNNTRLYSNYPVYSRPFPVTDSVVLSTGGAYYDSFDDASKAAWVPDRFFWQKGSPVGTVINGVSSGTNAWATNRRGPVRSSESATLYSPVFDLRANNGSSVPLVLGMRAWWDVVCAGGAQIRIASSVAGAAAPANFVPLNYISGTARNWYQSTCQPGAAWSNPGPNRYLPAYTELVNTNITQQRVQFAVVLNTVQDVEQDGFAFDDFAFGTSLTLPTEVRVNNIFPATPTVNAPFTIWWSVHELFGFTRTYGGTVVVTSSIAADGIVCQRAINTFSGVGQCTGRFTTTGPRTLTLTFTPTDGVHQVATLTLASPTNVIAADPTIVFQSVLPSPSAVGSTVTLSMLVQPSLTATTDGRALAGSVTVRDSLSAATCTGVLVSGATKCTMTFSNAGVRVLTATYTRPDSSVAVSTATFSHEVRQSTTAVSLLFPSSVKTGVPVTVTFRVSSSTTGAALQGVVFVSSNRDVAATCQVATFDGTGTCVLPPLTAGQHIISATFYSAGDLLPPSTGSGTLTVDAQLATFMDISLSPSTVVVSNGAVASVSIRVNDGSLPTGSVRFTIDGETLCAAAVVGPAGTVGSASCVIPAQFATGTRVIAASFPVINTSTLPGSSASATLTIIAPVTQLTALSSPNPTFLSNLTVTVSGTISSTSNQPLGGAITVSDSTNNERCLPSNAQYRNGGAFSCVLRMSSPVGVHPIVVRYQGDRINPAATIVFNHTVLPVPGTTVQPGQVPPVILWRPNENGPSIAQAKLLPYWALGRAVLRVSPTMRKRTFVENNAFRNVVSKALEMQLYNIGVDDAEKREFDFVLAADNGRSGALLIRSLIILVEVNDPDIRGTMLEGATITLIETPPPPQPTTPPPPGQSPFEPPVQPPSKVPYYYYGPPITISAAPTLSACASLLLALVLVALL